MRNPGEPACDGVVAFGESAVVELDFLLSFVFRFFPLFDRDGGWGRDFESERFRGFFFDEANKRCSWVVGFRLGLS